MNLLKNLAITGGLVAMASVANLSAASITNATLDGLGFYNGHGNPADSFVISSDNGTTLSLSIKTSFGDQPPSVEDANSSNYVSPAGTVDHTYGANTYTLAQWDYFFSVDTGAGHTVDEYDYSLTITDLTNSQSFTFNPIGLDNSGLNDNGTSFTQGTLDPTTQRGFQNAENIGFPVIGLTGWLTSNLPGDNYQITLAAFAPNTQNAEALNSVSVTVNNTPEPGTIVMMLSSLGVLGMYARRRKA